MEIIIVVIQGDNDWESHDGTFWFAGNVLFLDLSSSYMAVFTLKLHSLIVIDLFVCMLNLNKKFTEENYTVYLEHLPKEKPQAKIDYIWPCISCGKNSSGHVYWVVSPKVTSIQKLSIGPHLETGSL